MPVIGIMLDRIIQWKVYLDRSRMYLAYIQFIMVLVIFTRTLEIEWLDNIIENNQPHATIIGILFITFLMLVIGKLDTHFGVRQAEAKNGFIYNPMWLELRDDIKTIRKQTSKDDHSECHQ